MQELRKHRRVSFRGQVLINNLITAPGISLGEGGLFVGTKYLFKPESEIDVEFSLGKDTVKTRAQVRHGQNSIGMGMMFINLTALHYELIKKYVASISSEGTELDKKKILMIDPDPLKRRIYKGKLISDGFIVFEAGNGTEAFGIMQERDISLVLMDLYLKEQNGLDVIACIRKNPLWNGVPIIILASKDILYDITRAKTAGANEVLLKMTTPPIKLSGVIKKYFTQRQPVKAVPDPSSKG
jgi:CheY-like chemotaxis protein